ncbi:cysteine proteinase [Conidiobolus coronatus NRRL 28638]|uniref:Ubiquitin carboxyl-terminal hydrolase n=1 Tax=Conidiobolus coronatus (strain ATCC 28846 / CBS 209.66 / NRRL 28638) TaxID=796925 RepID=A0A137PHD5_CONC2|nr:cysteine proteinase [Conidiobolus coronatus NRRL 28638]|eukprot:KXN74398.1 cysteine proteinase [Conidiobolus coronatus NRRL 28638]
MREKIIANNSSLISAEIFLNDSLKNCLLKVSRALTIIKYYGHYSQKFIFANNNSKFTFSLVCGEKTLMMIINVNISGFNSILNFTAVWNSVLNGRLSELSNLTNDLLKTISKKSNKSTLSYTKKLFLKLNLGWDWIFPNTFRMKNNYKLTRYFEYCPIINIDYSEIYVNCGFIEITNGCLILLVESRVLKFIKSKYSKLPTKPEFEILLDIIYENICHNNYEDIYFEDKDSRTYKAPYTTGLKNLGNTCYMNSALQCILNNPHFQLFFDTVSRIDKFQFNLFTYPLLNATFELFKRLKLNKSLLNQIKEFKRAIGNYSPRFKNFNQQDSSEFLQCFLEHLNDEYILYFSNCPKNTTPTKKDNSVIVQAYQKDRIGYFSNLFNGLITNCITCGICNRYDYVTSSIVNLQLNIPHKEFLKFNVRIIPFDTNGKQTVQNLQISVEADLSVKSLKLDLEELISVPKDRLVIGIEQDIDKNVKELIMIHEEGIKARELSDISSVLYCFELPTNYDDEKSGYVIINQVVKNYGKFKHFGYNLFIIPIVDSFNFEHFYKSLVHSIPRVSNININNTKKRTANLLVDIPCKIIKTCSTSFRAKFGMPKIICDKLEYTPFNEKIFFIYKVNKMHSNGNKEKAILKIQTDAQFIESLPLVNGDNIILEWKDNSIEKKNMNCSYSSFNSINYKDQFQSFKHTNSFVSAILAPLHSLSLTFIEWVKDLISGEKVDIGKQERYPTLEDCIRDYLKPIYFIPDENPILNWECEFCGNNFGEKKESISRLPQYLMINFNRFKAGPNINNSKDDQFVECPLESYFNENDDKEKFSLIGVINHFGDLSGGHYTATCKNSFDGQWRNFNDTYVNIADIKDIISSETYMLIYQRSSSTIDDISLNLDSLPLNSKYFFTI